MMRVVACSLRIPLHIFHTLQHGIKRLDELLFVPLLWRISTRPNNFTLLSLLPD